MQHRPILRDVDLLAAKHGVDVLPQARLLGQRDQQPQRLVGNAVLRIIEEDSRALGRESLAAPRVGSE